MLSPPEILARAASSLAVSFADPAEIVALASAAVAAVLIVVSAFVKTIIPLRWLAVGSNAGFIVYGVVHPSPLMLVLHATLLPVNLFRTAEMIRLTRRVTRAAEAAEVSGVWLQPFMRRQRLRAGEHLFHRGDEADKLYFLAEGRIRLPEIGVTLESGRLFGEIAFFAPDRRRTTSAVCVGPCKVLSIDEGTFKQLYFQNPAFGFEVVRLIAARLTEDVRRLERRMAEKPTATPAPHPPPAAAPTTLTAPKDAS